MDEGEGNDPMDQFHRSEAISAVADEGFMADEDEDYDDLYNDVNVGEGFLQSMRGKPDVVEEDSKAVVESLPPPKAAPETGVSIPGVGGDGGDSGARFGQSLGFRGNDVGVKGGGGRGGPGIKVELGPGPGVSKGSEFEEQGGNSAVGGSQGIVHQQPQTGPPPPMLTPIPQQPPPTHMGNVNGGGGGGAGTMLFVGDLHWWTTDAELESELCKYGQVKEVKFFDEKASGKSKGYCQVEFYDPAAATACKEGMNGHVFNGRACVVAFASPFSVKRMGEAQVNRSQQTATQSSAVTQQARRGPNEPVGKPTGNNIATGGNYQTGPENNNNNNRGFGRGNWGRGNMQGMGNRGPVGQMRNRGGGAMGARGIMGNGGNGFGQGMGANPLMHPQSMMGQGFDPGFGAPMGRMGAYGAFPGAPTPPFSGILSSYPPVAGVGLPNVNAHVNPAFFPRGMPMNGMGMMPTGAVDGPNMMWPSDPQMGSWGPGGGGGGGGGGGDDHNGGRGGESSYGEEAASDHQYGEASHDRGGWNNSMKDKDRASERDWSGSSDRRYRDDREQQQQQQGYERDPPPREKDNAGHEDWPERRHRDDRERERERDREQPRSRDRERDRERDRDRERHREDRDRYSEHHRYKDRDVEHDEEWDRGRSSRTHSSKGGRSGQDDDHRSRSRDADYGKRRRLTSE